jgi:hypothetical protein
MELKNVKIESIGEIQEFGTNNYKVVKWVVVDSSNAEYPQTLELQCTQETAEKLIQYNKVGDVVDCSINLRGRKWTNPETKKVSVFNTIEAWKVFKSEGIDSAEPFETAPAISAQSNEEDLDLPF